MTQHRSGAATLPVAPAAIGFRSEFLDFARGIRVGNLEPHERITQVLKRALETRYRQAFVTDRWGRGVYWQWICFLPRANREAKPVSHRVNFGCAKLFVMVDTEERLFKCGLQVERGYLQAPREYRACELRPDWDWHRLVRGLRPGSALERELRRLVLREGFRLHAGSWENVAALTRENFPAMAALRRRLQQAPPREWSGFQLYYPMEEAEVRGASGVELVEAMLAVFEEVRPAMNLCMQVRLE